ncbi:MAG: hypothetical protein ACT4P7_20140 [Gemmatimonadaceae bacterium]
MLVVVAAPAARAQAARADSAAKAASAADAQGIDAKKVDAAAIPLSFTVPESPAFTFLGVSPAKVTRPSSARDLGAALINSVDSSGKVLTGMAIGASLWTLLSRTMSLQTYQTNPAAYAFANTAVSVGTARASGNDSTDTNVAIGFRATLFDHSDPMRNKELTGALANAFLGCMRSPPTATPLDTTPPVVPIPTPGVPPQPRTPVAAVPDSGQVRLDLARDDPRLVCAEKQSTNFRKRWFEENWNKAALSWGVGLGWRVPGSEFGHMQPLGVSTWLAGALPIGASAQLLTQLQLDHRNPRDTIDATTVLTYAARAVRGSDNHNFFFEVAGTDRVKTTPGVSRSNVQWSGGVELKIAEGYWLSTGFGKRYTEQGEPDRMVIIANMRWGISNDSRLKLIPGVK